RDQRIQIDALCDKVPPQLGGINLNPMIRGQLVEGFFADERHVRIPFLNAGVKPFAGCITIASQAGGDDFDLLVRALRLSAGDGGENGKEHSAADRTAPSRICHSGLRLNVAVAREIAPALRCKPPRRPRRCCPVPFSRPTTAKPSSRSIAPAIASYPALEAHQRKTTSAVPTDDWRLLK